MRATGPLSGRSLSAGQVRGRNTPRGLLAGAPFRREAVARVDERARVDF
ncbi:hypothetical protein [Streptomyces sp. NRRL B-24085]|nr:hypothetical protein [Streptomyces sp. NRRL B-24085]